MEDDDARTDGGGVFEDVCRDDDGFIGGGLCEEVVCFEFLSWVESVCGFVEYEDLGVMDECVCEGDASLITFRECADGFVEDMFDVGGVYDGVPLGGVGLYVHNLGTE